MSFLSGSTLQLQSTIMSFSFTCTLAQQLITRTEQCNNVHVTMNCHWNKTEKTTKLRAYKIK